MKLFHLEADTARFPRHPSATERVNLAIASEPVEPGQRVWVEWRVRRRGETGERGRTEATWDYNRAGRSYWYVNLGPFADGDRIEYAVEGEGPAGRATVTFSFEVGPKLHLALLWHQHQPLYRDPTRRRARPFLRFPWVRLHALRDYYGMAKLLEEFPELHVTINLTPSLLAQIEDYTDRGATDRALELSRTPVERLSAAEQEEILCTFFEAAWHTQIYPWPRYRELFEKRRSQERFEPRDLRDLQMWFNLAWFAPELQQGIVELPGGGKVSVLPLVERGADFTVGEIDSVLDLQLAILRSVVPLHRRLEERGQVEIATTPFYHPILPLVFDTDCATFDRQGAALPRRFSRPRDAEVQVSRALRFSEARFGRPQSGMWPAEGAVGQSVVGLLAAAGVRWIASDRGVLARSGRFGYDVAAPDVLCRAYRAEGEDGSALAVFFRDTALSDRIGFQYQRYAKAEDAARDFVRELKERFAWRVDAPSDRVLTVALDGENAWGGYAGQGRPFLRALYGALAADPEIRTVTFSEYLEGRSERRVAPHPTGDLTQVHDLFHGSWVDETGSAPGVELGTWIGEAEENEAWDRLREAGEFLDELGATPESHAESFEALYAAEGSDWFWWLGDDQSSGADADFEALFRAYLKRVYRAAGHRPPRRLDRHIAPLRATWSFAQPVSAIQPGDSLALHTNCPGRLEWRTESEPSWRREALVAAGGVMAGAQRYGCVLGPFDVGDRAVEFRFLCEHLDCDAQGPCCRGDVQHVRIQREADSSR